MTKATVKDEARRLVERLPDEATWEDLQNEIDFRQAVDVGVKDSAKSVEFDEAMMSVAFTDGRILSVPLAWFPTLRDATPEQRSHCEIGGGGVGLHWPELDEDLSIAGLMAGVDWRSA